MAQFTTPRPRQALALRKPRNPFVALSHQRSAGRHGPQGGARPRERAASDGPGCLPGPARAAREKRHARDHVDAGPHAWLARPASLRGWLAILLLGAGGRLIKLAWRVAPAAPRAAERAPTLEFSIETGAEGGRVYADGTTAGHPCGCATAVMPVWLAVALAAVGIKLAGGEPIYDERSPCIAAHAATGRAASVPGADAALARSGGVDRALPPHGDPVLASTAEQLELWRANEDAVDAHLLGEFLNKDPLMTLKLLAHAASQRSSRLLTDAETVTAALVLMGITPFFRAFGEQPTVRAAAGRASRRARRPAARAASRRARPPLRAGLRRAPRRSRRRGDPQRGAAARFLRDAALVRGPRPGAGDPPPATGRALAAQRDRAEGGAQHRPGRPGAGAAKGPWHLPELLAHITDDKKVHDPQVRCVTLAVRLARHTSESWENPAVPDDLIEIGELMSLSPAHTLKLVHEVDGVI
ncbi:hypothetical protein Ddc_23148 [Ditylenchus destructor]|nr:hypothetical protein Ddc_23148 [Ditylenchus destructor]